MSTQSRPRRRDRILAEARRRAILLDPKYPPIEELQKIGDPALRRLGIAHRATLTAMTGKNVSAEALEGLLMDANDALDVFTSAASSDDEGSDSSDASDCIVGCDQLLKDCLESWGEILLETDVDLFDGEAEEQEPGGGAVGSIDDNPLDVEVSDAGDTGADESEETHDDDGGPLAGISALEGAVLSGICSINYTFCLFGCTLEALGG